MTHNASLLFYGIMGMASALLGAIPGLQIYGTALSLISNTIQAAQGDYVALAMVVVTLAMVGVGMYMAHKSATASKGGAGGTGDSPGASIDEARGMYAEAAMSDTQTFQPLNAPSGDSTGFSDFLDIPIDWYTKYHKGQYADYILGPESEVTKKWSQNPWVRGQINEATDAWEEGGRVFFEKNYHYRFNTLKQYATTSPASTEPGHYVGTFTLNVRITPQGLITAQIINKSDVASASRLIPVAIKGLFGVDINRYWTRADYFGPYTTQRFYWFEHGPLPSTAP